MKYKSRFFGSALASMKHLSVMALAVVLLFAFPVASNAQETSAHVAGNVSNETGGPISSATVTIRSEATGLTRSATTNADGDYNIRNLPVGTEIYTMTVAGDGYAGARRSGVSINLGSTAKQDFALSTSAEMEEVVVFGTQQSVQQVAIGPSASFGIEALQTAPAINRNIADVVRIDPRIYVDESRGGINAVQCAGKNSRYNSLTVDGVRMNDAFGLNSNGYPTERMPFSYDAINQVSVELAPFDVIYGGFSACNINAVIKSGSNDFFGGAFYDYTGDSLRGSSLEGDKISTGAYTEQRFGFNFGGPIIQDKLFFFVALEMLEGANLFDRGAIGSGAVNEVDVTQFELDEIARIADEVYQYDVGYIPQTMDHSDEKLLLKFDWNISDAHRLAYTYTYNDGENFSMADSANNEIEFSEHLYERGAELNSHVGTLYSNWTDRFSTELRLGYLELDNRQLSVGGTDFGEMRIELPGVDAYIGGDDSRQSNFMDYNVTTAALRGTYAMDNHTLMFGYELESLDIYNVFVQHTETELRFNNLADFENQIADDIYYNNSPAHDPTDAAAEWGYAVNTLYLQDEFMIGDRLTLVAGVRYDFYATSDAPDLNVDFRDGYVDADYGPLEGYGFGNNSTLDGKSLVQPRLGFTYEISDRTTLTGGAGVYSGGNPNVWLSNTFSNDNTRQFGAQVKDYDMTNEPMVDCEQGVPTGPGWCIPEVAHDLVSTGTGSNFELNFLDPNFTLPSEVKLALGISHITRSDWALNADFLYTQAKDSAMVQRADLETNGTDADGYPQFVVARMKSFVLTNSQQKPKSTVLSFGVQKTWDWANDSIFLRFGYASTRSEDVQPMTSSVSFSNYTNRAFFDPNEDVISPSNYQTSDRFTFATRWTKEFSRSMGLTVALFGQYNSGQPYSYGVFGNSEGIYSWDDMYVNDNASVLEPGDTRNSLTGSSWSKLDLRVAFDFPGFSEGHKASVVMTIDNLTNLLNDEWGVLYKHNFPFAVEEGEPEARIGDASRYEIRFGLQYNFD